MENGNQEWRDIPEFEGYQINRSGEVRELRVLKKVEAKIGGHSYLVYSLKDDRGNRLKRVDNLTNEVFTEAEQAADEVIWREIPKYEGRYLLNNKGECMTIREKKSRVATGGKRSVGIRGKTRYIHKLINEVFGEQ